jgi:hypothetical protein
MYAAERESADISCVEKLAELTLDKYHWHMIKEFDACISIYGPFVRDQSSRLFATHS